MHHLCCGTGVSSHERQAFVSGAGLLLLQARLSAKQDRHYSSLGAVPGNNLELQAVDEERFTAAALFGLAGSQAGADLLLQQDSPVLTGMHAADLVQTCYCNESALFSQI